ncbi:glycosyltransferase [Cecembia lonarensis]|uniref:Glycosyl transferase family 1 domain-containing protein n=1 Tax=Cecembia lonarensis (strain CCUG 58316 / KCTC 22772 / LW9) TaxID=1225176 RepID=K1L4J1_CECL9|nr:glycosyltransferase [Cecembia lonarensis]EKB51325.1 hypothetical protein B879_00119 [Cecembia lonarensis LW9]
MKKLLIATKEQFGYHVDSYKYAEYLKDDFQITYVCLYQKRKKIPMEGIKLIYVPRIGNKVNRYLNLLKTIHQEIKNNHYDVVFVVYFLGCFIFQLLHPRQVLNLDIRTASVGKNIRLNFIEDVILKFECLFFKNISIIGENLRRLLNIKRAHILPLGGECFTEKPANMDILSLLYVGTLENRNLINFVKGFHHFFEDLNMETKNQSLKLIIVGDSPHGELIEIKDYIKRYRLEKVIETPGFIPNNQLTGFFEQSNVGVSYIPLTKYYQNQPPTKTFEYLLSGLPVIATATIENQKIVNASNGVLIGDDSDSVRKGLHEILEKKYTYNPESIKKDLNQSLWKNIVLKNLKPYLEGL